MLPEPSSSFEYRVAIAENHPASNGHFPGNPIIPGALIMEHVRVAFAQFRSGMYLKRMVKVKNLHVLRPGKTLIVKIHSKARDNYGFVCLDCDDNQIAAGDFHAAPIAAAATTN
ncbi:MAG: hypothetical protein P4L83_10080 [Nevskia sp.]|nr:hypothetical protein [Nevskia sp.]